MSQRNVMLLMLVVTVVMFGGLVAYDLKTNNRLDKIFGKDQKVSWPWNDNWVPDGTIPPVVPPITPPIVQPDTAPQVAVEAATYQEALTKAGELGRPIVVVFGADWCHWCKKLESETLPDAKVKAMLTNYVYVHVNTDNNRAVVSKFGVSGLPSYVITNSKEEKLKFGSGFKNGASFADWMNVPSLFKQPKNGVQPDNRVTPPQVTPPEKPQTRDDD